MRAAALCAIAASISLAGCSDLYYERREAVSSGGGDAVASNIAVQMVDPWPPYVNNTNIAMNGSRAELAIQRYKANRVLWSGQTGTSSAGYGQQQNQSASGAAVPAAGSTGSQTK